MYPGFKQRDKQCAGGGIFETILEFTSTLEDEKFQHYLYKISLVNLPMTLAFL